MPIIPQNEYATSKLVAKACGVADQRKVVIGCTGSADWKRANGRLTAKVDELVEAVDKFRAVVQP